MSLVDVLRARAAQSAAQSDDDEDQSQPQGAPDNSGGYTSSPKPLGAISGTEQQSPALGKVMSADDEHHDADLHSEGDEGGGSAAPKPTGALRTINAPKLPVHGVAEPEVSKNTDLIPEPSPLAAESAALPAVSNAQSRRMSALGSVKPVDVAMESPAVQDGDKFKAQKELLRENREKAALSGDPVAIGRAKLAEAEFAKMHPWGTPGNHEGALGKIAHVLGKVGGDALEVAAPNVAAILPGNDLHRALQEQGALGQIRLGSEADEKEAQAKAAGAKEPTVTEAGLRQKYADLQQQIANEKDPAKKAQLQQQADNIENSFGLGHKDTQVKEDDQPATAQQAQDVTTMVANNPYIPAEAKAQLQFPAGYKPTVGEVKQRVNTIKEIEAAARSGKEDALNNALRQALAEQNLEAKRDKQQKAEAAAASQADVRTTNLYAQEAYEDAMKRWYDSGHFSKDSGLVTEIINQEHGQNSHFSAALGGGLVGALLGGPAGGAAGAGIGSAVGAVGNMISGTANGYLDTLKKQGISPEGYAAMQAYFNTLPARFAYETDVQGLKASALRSSQLINKVLNTVPPPNTPQDKFEDAFSRYYGQMKLLTDRKNKSDAPKGYVPPKYEDLYPNSKSENKPSAGAAPKTFTTGGQTYNVSADGTFEHNGHTYKVQPDGSAKKVK